MPKGMNRWAKQKAHSLATRKLMSEEKLGAMHPKFTGFYIWNDEWYGSSYEAGRMTGFSYRSIQRWAKKKVNGWRFHKVKTVFKQKIEF